MLRTAERAQYSGSHPKPKSPRDLPNRRCINISMGSAGVYRWEFDKGTQSLVVGVTGPLTRDDMDMAIGAGDRRDGAGVLAGMSASPRTSRAVYWCASLRTDVLRSLGSSSITQPTGSNPRR